MKISKQQRAEWLVERFTNDVKKLGNTIINSIAYQKPLIDEYDRIGALVNRWNLIKNLEDCPALYGIDYYKIKPLLGSAEEYLQKTIKMYLNQKY